MQLSISILQLLPLLPVRQREGSLAEMWSPCGCPGGLCILLPLPALSIRDSDSS